MYTVTIYMHYLEKFGEILPGNSMDAQAHLRELVEHVLLDFFSRVAIDQVRMCPLPDTEEEDKRFALCITAHCTSNTDPGVWQDLTLLELMVEDRVSCTLLELVGMIEVEEVSITNPSMQEEPVLSFHS